QFWLVSTQLQWRREGLPCPQCAGAVLSNARFSGTLVDRQKPFSAAGNRRLERFRPVVAPRFRDGRQTYCPRTRVARRERQPAERDRIHHVLGQAAENHADSDGGQTSGRRSLRRRRRDWLAADSSKYAAATPSFSASDQSRRTRTCSTRQCSPAHEGAIVDCRKTCF